MTLSSGRLPSPRSSISSRGKASIFSAFIASTIGHFGQGRGEATSARNTNGGTKASSVAEKPKTKRAAPSKDPFLIASGCDSGRREKNQRKPAPKSATPTRIRAEATMITRSGTVPTGGICPLPANFSIAVDTAARVAIATVKGVASGFLLRDNQITAISTATADTMKKRMIQRGVLVGVGGTGGLCTCCQKAASNLGSSFGIPISGDFGSNGFGFKD